MTISNRDKQLLVVFAGILLVALTYFFLFTKMQEKTELLKASNLVLQDEVTKLNSLAMQKQGFLAKAEEYTQENSRIQASFDNGYTLEDDIMYVAELENDQTNEIGISFLNLSTPQEVAAVITTTQGEMQMAPVLNQTALFKVTSDFGYEISYQGFKNMVRYLYSNGGRKNIEKLSLMFNTETGQLAGAMTLNRYFMTGTDSTYSPLPIPTMPIGVDNIFRTTGSGTQATVETEEDTETDDVETEDAETEDTDTEDTGTEEAETEEAAIDDAETEDVAE